MKEDSVIAENVSGRSGKNFLIPASIVVGSAIIAGAWLYTVSLGRVTLRAGDPLQAIDSADVVATPGVDDLTALVDGVELPVRWGGLGAEMVRAGVINAAVFEQLHTARSEFDSEARKLLTGSDSGNLNITRENAGVLLNLFWALGLGNENPILSEGPISNQHYGGADRCASTAGWTLAVGDPMRHFNRHPLIALTPQQQELIRRMSEGIYRPCCDNPTHFPDCNHGMAMLGFLELMASQDVPESEMYAAALVVNSYWFPDTYRTIKTYIEGQGMRWSEVNPKQILGRGFSSSSGYRYVLSQAQSAPQRGNVGCGA